MALTTSETSFGDLRFSMGASPYKFGPPIPSAQEVGRFGGSLMNISKLLHNPHLPVKITSRWSHQFGLDVKTHLVCQFYGQRQSLFETLNVSANPPMPAFPLKEDPPILSPHPSSTLSQYEPSHIGGETLLPSNFLWNHWYNLALQPNHGTYTP